MVGWSVRVLGSFVVSSALVLSVTGCRIEVPVNPGAGVAEDPSASVQPRATPTAGATAGSAELPPLPRAAIVGNDMTFERGGYIEKADMVTFSETMSRAPGWAQNKLLVNGESVYASEAGCTASLSRTGVQNPLLVAGDDRASTEALFRFVDPSILPEYLDTTGWSWGSSPEESTASIDFLTYRRKAIGDAPASVISLRLFHQTGTALAFIISCPSDKALTAAVADVQGHVSVVPPG